MKEKEIENAEEDQKENVEKEKDLFLSVVPSSLPQIMMNGQQPH